MTDKKSFFERNDAWVFLSLSLYDGTYKAIDLPSVIGAGDMLNQAIFLPEELRQGFRKLHSRGLIDIKGNKIRLTQLGIEVKSKVKGGLFSQVDNCLKRLNSPRLTHKEIKFEEEFLAFLSDEAVEDGYKKYKTVANKR